MVVDERVVVVGERLVLAGCPLCGNDAALVFGWLPWFPIEPGAQPELLPELVPEAAGLGLRLIPGAVLAVAGVAGVAIEPAGQPPEELPELVTALGEFDLKIILGVLLAIAGGMKGKGAGAGKLGTTDEPEFTAADGARDVPEFTAALGVGDVPECSARKGGA